MDSCRRQNMRLSSASAFARLSALGNSEIVRPLSSLGAKSITASKAFSIGSMHANNNQIANLEGAGHHQTACGLAAPVDERSQRWTRRPLQHEGLGEPLGVLVP